MPWRKPPVSPVQGLFNCVEYLLRKATQIKRDEEHDHLLQEVIRKARLEATRLGLKGDEATEYVHKAEMGARGPKRTTRVPREEVIALVVDAWDADLTDFDVFTEFMQKLLSLKYAENTVTAIVEKATEIIDKKQDTANPEQQHEGGEVVGIGPLIQRTTTRERTIAA